MQSRGNFNAVWQLTVLLALVSGGVAGCASGPAASSAAPLATQLGRKANVLVDSSPTGATISVNGAVKGSAPLNIQVDLDDLGEIAIDLDITADFSDSFGGAKPAAVATHRLVRGDRVPETITLDPDGAAAR